MASSRSSHNAEDAPMITEVLGWPLDTLRSRNRFEWPGTSTRTIRNFMSTNKAFLAFAQSNRVTETRLREFKLGPLRPLIGCGGLEEVYNNNGDLVLGIVDPKIRSKMAREYKKMQQEREDQDDHDDYKDRGDAGGRRGRSGESSSGTPATINIYNNNYGGTQAPTSSMNPALPVDNPEPASTAHISFKGTERPRNLTQTRTHHTHANSSMDKANQPNQDKMKGRARSYMHDLVELEHSSHRGSGDTNANTTRPVEEYYASGALVDHDEDDGDDNNNLHHHSERQQPSATDHVYNVAGLQPSSQRRARNNHTKTGSILTDELLQNDNDNTLTDDQGYVSDLLEHYLQAGPSTLISTSPSASAKHHHRTSSPPSTYHSPSHTTTRTGDDQTTQSQTTRFSHWEEEAALEYINAVMKRLEQCFERRDEYAAAQLTFNDTLVGMLAPASPASPPTPVSAPPIINTGKGKGKKISFAI